MTTMSMSVVVFVSRIFFDSFDSPLADAAAAFCRQFSNLSRFLSASRIARNNKKFWKKLKKDWDKNHFQTCLSNFRKVHWRPGVNFTNVLRTAFTPVAPQSVRIQSSYQYLFRLLGSTSVKAVHKTLVKLSPGWGLEVEPAIRANEKRALVIGGIKVRYV